MRISRLLPLALALSLTAAAPAAAADGPIATLPEVSPVKSVGDTVAWEAGGKIVVSQAGRITTLAIEPGEGGFDLGTDARGNRRIVYTRCGRTCDLRIATLDGVSKPIRNASSPHYDESAPTLWAGRLAWARKDVIYTRKLTDSSRVRSKRLGTVPRRSCGGINGRCSTTRGRSVDELELHNGRLAELVSYEDPNGAGQGRYDIRLTDPRTGRRRNVKSVTIGEGGQSVFGLSAGGGRIAWALTCFGDPSGCGFGAARFTPSTGVYERTRSPSGLVGFSLLDRDSAYVLVPTGGAEGNEGSNEGLCPCHLEERTITGWRVP